MPTSMIEDLQNPANLPDETQHVALVQTHISQVLVGDRFVYKIKKAVDFGFLDFSTLKKRRYYCEQEVVLNRRLAEDIYLGVLPIVYDGSHYRMGVAEGETVEYGVKMRRIPEDVLMKHVFRRGEITQDHLTGIAEVLSRFHRSASVSPDIAQFGEAERFKINTDENFEQTEKYIGMTIPADDFAALRRWTEDFYGAHHRLFAERIKENRIADCHGDLHMEHICLTENIDVIDCIEFNDRFRYSDTLSDIAFLLMDLEFQGGEALARTLWDLYRERAGEEATTPLLTFYKVYRAYVRGKVTSFQLDDENIAPDEKEQAAQTARRYFRLARSYIEGGL
jgi:aminoglycoside phosphotransferase family enzyme